MKTIRKLKSGVWAGYEKGTRVVTFGSEPEAADLAGLWKRNQYAACDAQRSASFGLIWAVRYPHPDDRYRQQNYFFTLHDALMAIPPQINMIKIWRNSGEPDQIYIWDDYGSHDKEPTTIR